MGKFDAWESILSELEMNGYEICRDITKLTFQIKFPDGLVGRINSLFKEESVLDAIEYAHSHLRISQALLETGYVRSEGAAWVKLNETFKDFRYAYNHLVIEQDEALIVSKPPTE